MPRCSRTSVIIPVYNGQEYLADALQTVSDQVRPVKEIVVIDDGSNPPITIPKQFQRLPITLVRTANQGLGRARNLAASFCSGEYLALLDCDDLWHPYKIACQEDVLDAHAHAVLCYSHIRYFPEPSVRTLPRYPSGKRSEQLSELWKRNYIVPSSVMVRRTAWLRVGGGDPFLSGVADWELWWRLAHLGPFICVSQPLTYYRLHPAQMTKNLYRMLREESRAKVLMARRVHRLLRRIGLSQEDISQSVLSTRHFLYDYILYYHRGVGSYQEIASAWLTHTNDLKLWKLLFRGLIPTAWISRLRKILTRIRSQLHGFANKASDYHEVDRGGGVFHEDISG